MSESTLSLAYSDIAAELGFFLGYGRDSTQWGTAKTAQIDALIQSGLRQFYFPPPVPPSAMSHQWSFLEPTAALATVASDADMDLPDDFGAIIGPFTFAADESWSVIRVVGEGQIRARRQEGTTTGVPRFAAVQPLSVPTSSKGQRWQVMFWPTPDAVYNLTYRYKVIPNKLSVSANPYHYGGGQHAETVLESCLAIAEQRAPDGGGLHSAKFQQCLAASISFDRNLSTPEFFGRNRDSSGDYEPDRVGIVTNEGVTGT